MYLLGMYLLLFWVVEGQPGGVIQAPGTYTSSHSVTIVGCSNFQLCMYFEKCDHIVRSAAAMDAAAPPPPSVQMQLAVLDSRLKNLEEVMSNRVIPSLDRLEVRLTTMERMMVAMGATVAGQARHRSQEHQEFPQERARPY